MKKFFSVLLVGLMVSMLAVGANAAFDRTYTAPKGTPTIDAEVDDIWENADWTEVDKPYDGTTDTDSTLRMKLLWDEDHLYFLAEIHDTDHNQDNDIVEVYLDQNNDKDTVYGDDDYQTRFYITGGVFQDSGTNCQNDAASAAKDLGNGNYILEGALTWPAGAPVEGANMGIEFMYNEGDSTADFTEAYRWNVDTANGDGAPYADTSAFGTLVLGAAPVVVVEEVVEDAPVAADEAAAPAEATTTAAAPQTFDVGVIAAIGAIVSAAGYAIAKKR